MNEADKRLCAFTLENMFKKKKYFDICTVDKVLKIAGCSQSGAAYDRLRSLHCVDWGDIPEDIMQMIPVWLNQILDGPSVSVLQIPALREGNVHQIGLEDAPPALTDKTE